MAVLYSANQYFSTTLNVGGGIDNSQTTGIVLQSVSGLDITKAGIACLSYADPLVTSTAEWVTFTSINGSNELQGVTRGAEGFSAKAHANGVTIAFPISESHINNLVSKLDGTDTTTAAILGKAQFATTDPTLASGLNIQVAAADPTRGIYIPASAMFAATTNGADVGQYESATNKINVKVLDFDGATEQYAWFCMPAPSYWDLGTVTAEFHWTFASGSGDVIWGIAGLARSNDDALDTALGSAVLVTDTCITALDEHLTSDTSAMTIGGTPAKDDFLFFRIYRDADAGGDTLNGVDARLIGVTIRYKRSQYEDA